MTFSLFTFPRTRTKGHIFLGVPPRRIPLVLAAAALLSAGCGATGTGAGSGPAVPSASAAGAASDNTSAGAPSSGAGSSGATASTGGSGTAGCTTSNLKAALGQGQGAAGSTYVEIDFTNTGGTPCTLYGYPGVSLANSGGPIGAPATRDRTRPPSLVRLARGAEAHALLRVVDAQNYPAGTCSPESSSFLLIYPPDQTAAIDVPDKSTGCKNKSVKVLSIRPVAPGAGDGNS